MISRFAYASLALLVVLAALLAVALPYRPILTTGPTVEPAHLSLAEPLPRLRLHVFNTGANRMSSLLVGPEPPWRAVPAFVIEHPSRGLIAFDLGLSHEAAEHGERALPIPLCWLMESRGRSGFTLEAQMREAGLSPRNVTHVVISHLHEDHTGVASEFVDATFLAGPGTHAPMIEGPQSPFASARAPDWREVDFSGKNPPLGPFEAGVDIFGDGSLLLIAGGGHSPEDVMALINLPGGPVLLTGDVVVHFDWLASDDVERVASDPQRAATLRNQVRSLHDSGQALIIPGHDLRHLGVPRDDLLHQHAERFVPSHWPITSAD